MDERLTRFWKELLAHCKEHNQFEFVYAVEYWGYLWMPWFIYLDNRSLKFSLNDLSDNDLKWLVDNDYLEFLGELEPTDTIDLSRELYSIKNHHR